jgi:hypothetical protein
MTLSASIMYKSNWQQGAIKCSFFTCLFAHLSPLIFFSARRRNKWVCALKTLLAECGVYGPAGKPATGPKAPAEYTLVPWDEAKRHKNAPAMPTPSPTMPQGGWQLSGDGDNFSACRDSLSPHPCGTVLFPSHSLVANPASTLRC